MSEKFEFKKDTADKKISIIVNGRIEDGFFDEFIKSYTSTVSSVNASEYTLDVDFTTVPITPQNLTDVLRDALKLYKKDNFKKINVYLSQSQIIVKMQIKRIANEIGLNNVELIMK